MKFIRNPTPTPPEILKDLEKYIAVKGYIKIPTGNVYEFIRCRLYKEEEVTEILSAYKNNAGRESWDPRLWAFRQAVIFNRNHGRPAR